MLSFHTWLEPTSVLSLSHTHTSCENPWDNSLIAKAYTSLTCEPHQSLVHVPFTFSDKTRKLSAHQLQKKYHASDIFNLRLTVPALSTSVADITWSITLETVSQFFALCLLQFLPLRIPHNTSLVPFLLSCSFFLIIWTLYNSIICRQLHLELSILFSL